MKIPLLAKERQQRWRDKKVYICIYRQSEHDRYGRRKQLGLRKLVKDMSTREHRMQMRKCKKWKNDSIRRHRENEQLPNVASTPTVKS